MNKMTDRVRNFIVSHKMMTLGTSEEGRPYCSVLFYSFDETNSRLYFVSKESSRHGREVLSNSAVAGSIIRDESNVFKLQGIQFTGRCFLLNEEESSVARSNYLSAHPLAILLNESMWCVTLDWIKMTDNTLGFGKKIIWERTPALLDGISE